MKTLILLLMFGIVSTPITLRVVYNKTTKQISSVTNVNDGNTFYNHAVYAEFQADTSSVYDSATVHGIDSTFLIKLYLDNLNN